MQWRLTKLVIGCLKNVRQTLKEPVICTETWVDMSGE